MNDKLLPQTATEKIIEDYANELAKKNREIELLNDKLAEVSTVSYSAGTPQVKYNRGDESNDFSFPVRWAQTCKKMETSIYLEPVLQFYKNTFNTFKYDIKIPDEYEENQNVKLAYDFIVKQFERAGGLKNLIVNIAYNTLVYGFAFFTPKLDVIDGKKFNVKGKIDGLKGFKYYDPTQIYNFVFKETDADELQAITLLTSPKLLGGSDKNKGYMLEDYFNEWAEGNFENAKFIKIDFDLMLGGYATYGNMTGDVIGRPFLYSAYSMWQVLESMDNSFNRNLTNIGEHSFNFTAYNGAEGLSEEARQTTLKELKDFVKNKGGIFIGSHGKLEKIECIDANEWWQFRDSMLSSLFKNKGLDIKALGLNRGATKDLASFAQTDTVLMANDIMENIIKNINDTFMRRYFDLNFKSLRTSGVCDYFQIIHEVPEVKNQAGQSFMAMSGTDDIRDGATWKTLENGEHVLVSSNDEILSGAGIENWKNTGKATNPNVDNQNKQKRTKKELKEEIEAKKKLTQDLSKQMYNATGEEHDRLDKLFEEEYAKKTALENELKELEAEEKNNKKRTNAEKDGIDKDKKITKNYSVSYDKETIDKLNEVGKNWQDKRIYFDELNNSYYDLEKEKWVCDSPETTKKALEMAGETKENRTARLKAEEDAKRQKAYEKHEANRKVAYSVKDRMNTKEFEKQFFREMSEAGMFDDMSIPKGSINKITNKMFKDDELTAWYDTYKSSSDTYDNLKDIVYDRAKKELDTLNSMYQPKKWDNWLYTVKNINNGKNVKNDSSFKDMMNDYNFDDFAKDYFRNKNAGNPTKMSNSEAWAKYGDEFNKYKADTKKEAKAKIKEYIKKKLQDDANASGIKGDDGVKKETIELKDKDGNISTQQTTFDRDGNPTSQKSRIYLGKFIKRKPNGLESYIIKDTSLLNQNLIVLSDELNDYILEFMKEAMRDPKIIELALKKPDEFIKTSLLTPAKRKELLEELKGILERNVGDLFDIKATEIINGSGKTSKDFQAIFGMAKNEWLNKMTQEYIRKNAINVGRALIAKTELKATEALRNFTAGYTKDKNISEAVNNVFERVFQFQGKGIDTASQNEAVSVFQEVSNQANNDAVKRNKDLAFIRCGYLENMCKECQKYYNVLYLPNGVGGYYNSEGIEYKELPDSDCLGGKENCKCYYATIDTKVLDIINNMLEN